MTENKCGLESCPKSLPPEPWVVRGVAYCSINHAGQASVQPTKKRKSKKEKRPKEWRQARKRFVKETKGVNWEEKPKPLPEPILHQEVEKVELEAPWAKVKYAKETYVAAEVVILTRTTDDSMLNILMSGMRNVRMYMDDAGGILLRPIQPSTTALPAKAVPNGTPALASGSEPSVDRKERRSRNTPVTLTGNGGLNPAKPDSKRYYLIEAMIDGGSVREIFKRAASLYHKSTGKPKSELGMVATPSNLALMYDWLVKKLSDAGKNMAVKETNGEYKLYEA